MKLGDQVRICVPVCETNAHDLAHTFARAAEVADVVELRLDCLDEKQLELAKPTIAAAISKRARPVVVTYRPSEQGGLRILTLPERLSFTEKVSAANSDGKVFDYIDVEADLVTLLSRRADHEEIGTAGIGIHWNSVICSHHDFAGVPADLNDIYQRMASTPAHILKVAVHADDVTDCIPLFNLLARARSENREMIAIAMGDAGLATRVLGPSRGAFLTYGALDKESATAPGQVTADELRTLYRIHAIDRQTQITGLVGFPVAHSVSPLIHNAAFASAGVNAVYMPFPVRDLAAFFKRMVHPRTREINWPIRGLSITAPHKTEVMNYLDWIDPNAKDIGAVNTVVVESDTLLGYNTDAPAFVETLRQRFGELGDARCALLGSGGAAAAALCGLRREGAKVTVFARDDQKGKALAERFGANWKHLGSSQFDGFDLVVNATTLGTSGSQELETPATADQLRGARLAYDLVYNPLKTRFLNEARAVGCDGVGGLAMLIAQAVDQFSLWTGAEAPREVMSEAALKALQAERK